jgi:S1-C subfamily serine protease
MCDVLFALLLAPSVLAAPVPKERPPDPLAWGYLGVTVNPPGSLQVSSVQPGSPALAAGLMVNDTLVKVGTVTPTSFDEVAEHISSFRPGSLLRVEVRRGDGTKAVVVRLGVRPADLPPPPVKNRLPVPVEP